MSNESMTLDERFEQFADDYIKFEAVNHPLSKRPDLCAFLMLEQLCPGSGDMITSSEHDEFYLDVDCEKLHEVATDEQIRDLVRCGIRYSPEYGCLCMFA